MMAESDEMRRTRNDRDEIGGLQVYRGEVNVLRQPQSKALCTVHTCAYHTIIYVIM